MGIYLPNMEMPRNGQMLVIFPDGTSYVCFNGMRERLTQTTAVPVPPHGRLIDVDAVISEDGPYEYEEWCKWALDRYMDAPTIIPADPEKEVTNV